MNSSIDAATRETIRGSTDDLTLWWPRRRAMLCRRRRISRIGPSLFGLTPVQFLKYYLGRPHLGGIFPELRALEYRPRAFRQLGSVRSAWNKSIFIYPKSQVHQIDGL